MNLEPAWPMKRTSIINHNPVCAESLMPLSFQVLCVIFTMLGAFSVSLGRAILTQAIEGALFLESTFDRGNGKEHELQPWH